MEIIKGNKVYEFDIDVKELNPPIGSSIFYYSKVAYLYLDDGVERKKLDIEFGEFQDNSKDGAREKMKKAVEKWVEEKG